MEYIYKLRQGRRNSKQSLIQDIWVIVMYTKEIRTIGTLGKALPDIYYRFVTGATEQEYGLFTSLRSTH